MLTEAMSRWVRLLTFSKLKRDSGPGLSKLTAITSLPASMSNVSRIDAAKLTALGS